jgi:hypothetical protein
MPRLQADALCGPVSGAVSSHYGALPVRPSPTRSRSQLGHALLELESIL